MHVLVTGGTGYIGAWTTHKLLDAGHDVRLLAGRERAFPGLP